ncbi:ATP-binding cassette domain-containing protein [Paraburkholderia sp. LEh10]|uniref:ATP-binding cassette domain-containing protein n=1 Tax=Paraburkholderia sp. LEh10 TaxID=2821353 RepID=UPI001AEAA164|nr:ATP-binding cassette domain-containing protein [Paraburkholderia sp. LEh10]MBP0589408.1 ATP-binding cassette domain-containing protein [Paraburkholderia sp. LEh10]
MALSDASIDFMPGSVHAIVGENGAGKSTLINVASGTVEVTTGEIFFNGRIVDSVTTAAMRELGVAVVHQHPALLPDLTLRENVAIGLSRGLPNRWMVMEKLAEVAQDGMGIDPDDRLSHLSIAQWHVVEIVKALYLVPKVLILDEPTEPFGREQVERLFELIRRAVIRGVAVVYISHRLKEVMTIADTITVLRDGRVIETIHRANVVESEIVAKIAGRPMDRFFPEKAVHPGRSVLSVKGLSGKNFKSVDMDLCSGMVVGLAGIEEQGQRSFLRALAGLESVSNGQVVCDGVRVKSGDRAGAHQKGIGFVTDDRLADGLFMSHSLVENVTASVLDKMTRWGFLSTGAEIDSAREAISNFSVKAHDVFATPKQLSGGNQQKVLLVREFSASPKVLLIDEPTKGVDVGARFEIYQALRSLSEEGTAILVLCSDSLELQGLCDKVHVFSNGTIVETLEGSDVTEAKIAAAMVSHGYDGHEKSSVAPLRPSTPWKRFSRGDLFPIFPVALVSLAILGCTATLNSFFFTEINLLSLAALISILVFVSLGQACVFIIGGIDLSSGPLAGLVVVLSSFLLGNSVESVSGGVCIILLIAIGVGVLHAFGVLALRLPSVVVTLATFVAIGGVSLYLRPKPEGVINPDYIDLVESQSFGMPVQLLFALLAMVALGILSRSTGLGRQMRAWGSDNNVAAQLGVRSAGITTCAYVLSALLSGIAGLLLAAQVGIGSAATGSEYTLMGITAVVISGASVTGGKLSFMATVVAACFVQLCLNITAFLNMNSAWQYFLVGGATLLGAAIFGLLQGGKVKAA